MVHKRTSEIHVLYLKVLEVEKICLFIYSRSNLKQAQLYGFAYGFSQCVVFAMYGGAFRFGAWQVSVGDMAPENVYK